MSDLKKKLRKKKKERRESKFVGNCAYYLYCKVYNNSFYAAGLFQHPLKI